MDGEVGRFEFAVYVPRDGRCELFASQSGKGRYATIGFKEVAVYHGASHDSYRTVCQRLNRQWRQPGALRCTSLQAEVHQEGQNLCARMEQVTREAFEHSGFDAEGQPTAAPAPQQAWQAMCSTLLEQTRKALAADAPEQVREAVVEQKLVVEHYECKEHTVYNSVDDVSCKRQKADRPKKRKRSAAAPAESPPAAQCPQAQAPVETLKFVHNSCARLQCGQGDYTLVADGLGQLLRWLTAVLLNNQLLAYNWLFLVDGERSIRNHILEMFAWRPIRLLLDWYHLDKKCRELLSTALSGKERTKQVREQLRLFLWYGLVPQALDYLLGLDPGHVKSDIGLGKLKGYLERQQEYIPNYALRKELGLPNSSNPAENANNQVVALRQKKKGSSWSDNGSHDLAKVIAINVNGERAQWLRSGKLSLLFRKKAA